MSSSAYPPLHSLTPHHVALLVLMFDVLEDVDADADVEDDGEGEGESEGGGEGERVEAEAEAERESSDLDLDLDRDTSSSMSLSQSQSQLQLQSRHDRPDEAGPVGLPYANGDGDGDDDDGDGKHEGEHGGGDSGGDSGRKPLDAELQTQVLLVLTRHVLGVVEHPKRLDGFVEELLHALEPREGAKALVKRLSAQLDRFTTLDALHNLFEQLGLALSSPEDTAATMYLLERRSPFGIFLRKCRLNFNQLDFHLAVELFDALDVYRGARADVGPAGIDLTGERDVAVGDEFVVATATSGFDRPYSRRLDTLQTYQRAVRQGDLAQASESLRSFYDHEFPASERGLHQHALLNLAAFHHQTGGLGAARRALNEAIKLARNEGDLETSRLCQSFLRRLDAQGDDGQPGPSTRPGNASTGTHALTPLDEMWEAQIGIMRGEPIHKALPRLARAKGLSMRSNVFDVKKADSGEAGKDRPEHVLLDNTAWHAVQGDIWAKMGSETLSSLHHSLGTKRRRPKGRHASDARTSIAVGRARQLALAGAYERALELLFQRDATQDMSIYEIQIWQDAVWRVLYLQARRGTDMGTMESIKQLYPQVDSPAGSSSPDKGKDRQRVDSAVEVERLLIEARSLMRAEQPALALSPLLTAVELSHRRDLLDLHRAASVSLAELFGLAFDMPGYGKEVVESYLPQIMTSVDAEERGLAFFVYARCLMAASRANENDLRTAYMFLMRARAAYEDAGCLNEALQSVLYYIVRLSHHSGFTEERDKTAMRHSELDRQLTSRRNSRSVNTLVDTAASLIADLSAAVAGGG